MLDLKNSCTHSILPMFHKQGIDILLTAQNVSCTYARNYIVHVLPEASSMQMESITCVVKSIKHRRERARAHTHTHTHTHTQQAHLKVSCCTLQTIIIVEILRLSYLALQCSGIEQHTASLVDA